LALQKKNVNFETKCNETMAFEFLLGKKKLCAVGKGVVKMKQKRSIE